MRRCRRGAISCSAQAAARGDWLAAADGSVAPSGYIVLAMGKHGAFELNYSSDIDLIVFYDRDLHPPARRAWSRSVSSCA